VTLISGCGMNPPVMSYFKSIPEGCFSYNHYGLRHPGAIYNVTTYQLIRSIVGLHGRIANGGNYLDIYNDFRLVVYDLFKFYDACYEIMQRFTRPHEPPDGFIHKWLKLNGYNIGKYFFDNIKADSDFLYL